MYLRPKKNTSSRMEQCYQRSKSLATKVEIQSQSRFYSAKDIQHATNNYDPNLILGSVITTTYKGTLDEQEVAIKVKGPPTHWPFEMMVDFFLNQVTIKQLVSHKNIMRLYGCCLETEIPMLVFELISMAPSLIISMVNAMRFLAGSHGLIK